MKDLRALGLIIAAVSAIALVIFGGVYYALVGHLHANPPSESFRYRTANAEVNSKGDTIVVNIIDKRVYIYKTLTNEQKQELREAIK